ncbi:MAG: D-alanyl-D-alanine carboxypeptidase [Flavobacteriaceae bacterium]
MYGNVITISRNKDSLQSFPDILNKNVTLAKSLKQRDYNSNTFFYNPATNDTVKIPMVINNNLIKTLWSDLTNKDILIENYSGNKQMKQVAYSIPSDSLYKRMMLASDNFLAEQVLILASSATSDMLSSNNVRNTLLKTKLFHLKQKPRWVDGSGLSRYNLFTPTSLVQVLTDLYHNIPHERLFNFFPVGGKSGTLKQSYTGTNKPYIYAKSGTLSNNYALSGYLMTHSGETLIFSFMNNHYTTPTTEVKKEMQSVLEWFCDNY